MAVGCRSAETSRAPLPSSMSTGAAGSLPDIDRIGPRAGEHKRHIGPRAGEHKRRIGPRAGGFDPTSLAPSKVRARVRVRVRVRVRSAMKEPVTPKSAPTRDESSPFVS